MRLLYAFVLVILYLNVVHTAIQDLTTQCGSSPQSEDIVGLINVVLGCSPFPLTWGNAILKDPTVQMLLPGLTPTPTTLLLPTDAAIAAIDTSLFQNLDQGQQLQLLTYHFLKPFGDDTADQWSQTQTLKTNMNLPITLAGGTLNNRASVIGGPLKTADGHTLWIIDQILLPPVVREAIGFKEPESVEQDPYAEYYLEEYSSYSGDEDGDLPSHCTWLCVNTATRRVVKRAQKIQLQDDHIYGKSVGQPYNKVSGDYDDYVKHSYGAKKTVDGPVESDCSWVCSPDPEEYSTGMVPDDPHCRARIEFCISICRVRHGDMAEAVKAGDEAENGGREEADWCECLKTKMECISQSCSMEQCKEWAPDVNKCSLGCLTESPATPVTPTHNCHGENPSEKADKCVANYHNTVLDLMENCTPEDTCFCFNRALVKMRESDCCMFEVLEQCRKFLADVYADDNCHPDVCNCETSDYGVCDDILWMCPEGKVGTTLQCGGVPNGEKCLAPACLQEESEMREAGCVPIDEFESKRQFNKFAKKY
eukprot:TRINITY_DN60187_c0_g1_i1.p1 TRINITY_DN60187_c0_g1~~TRINITY_DN60187_c0_g1_i1.p1  ORF type:complete len:536 (-),score=36.88 TRINITY_DN60187_c0_g1_i1:825-2432(-)